MLRTEVGAVGTGAADNVGAGISSDCPNVAVSWVVSATGPCSKADALPSKASDFVGAGIGCVIGVFVAGFAKADALPSTASDFVGAGIG